MQFMSPIYYSTYSTSSGWKITSGNYTFEKKLGLAVGYLLFRYPIFWFLLLFWVIEEQGHA